MNQDKYVFAQLTSFLNRTQFNNYVRKYDGNKYVKHFTSWNQLLTMMFGQLSNRESLRDLIVAFEAHRSKQYQGVSSQQRRHSHQLTRIATVESSKILPIIWLRNHVPKAPKRYSVLMVMCTPLTPQRQTSVLKFSSGPGSESTKEESRFTPSMILKHRFLHSFISQQHRLMI